MALAQSYNNIASNTASYSLYELELLDSTHQISIAQMLGRDYLFLPDNVDFNARGFNDEVSQIMSSLDLSSENTVVISFIPQDAKKPLFVRHEFSWHQGKIGKVVSIPISSREQQEFMCMLWDCSSPA